MTAVTQRICVIMRIADNSFIPDVYLTQYINSLKVF